MKIYLRPFGVILAIILVAAFSSPLFAAQKKYPFTGSEDQDGARFVWFVFKEAKNPFPYFSTKNFRRSERFRQLTAEAPASGDVLWWPDYVAVYSNEKNVEEVLSALDRTPLSEETKKRGTPVYLRYVPVPPPKKVPADGELKKLSTQLEVLGKVADTYPLKVSVDEELKKVKTTYAAADTGASSLVEKYPDVGVTRLMAGRLYRYGHNLETGSWNKARDNLTKAMTLMPDNPLPYLELGQLLVNTSIDYAANAEYLFTEAMRLSDNRDIAEVGLRGLVYARYYKGDMEGALTTADKFLEKWPNEPAMLQLIKNIKTNPVKKDHAKSGVQQAK